MKRLLFFAFALLEFAISAQSTVTLTPSITAGDGTLVTDVSWSTNPPLTTGTPCTATNMPSTPQWTGAKAGSGSVTGLVFTADQRLTLACTFPGDSIVTFTWTNPTTNTNDTPYTDPKLVRIKHTFDNTAALILPTIACGGVVVCTDVAQTPTPSTMHTVTGITETGTLRAVALAVNQRDVASGPSNATSKVFTGNVTVTQMVDLIVRSVPNVITGFGAQ